VYLLLHLDEFILWICWVAAIPVGVFAVFDAARTRADAFTAAGKLTKPGWTCITGIGLLVLLFTGDPFHPLGPLTGRAFQGGPMTVLWVVGLIAVLLYLVDVRPSLIEVQGGRR
jgi:Protein of unknown function (DUF2516)